MKFYEKLKPLQLSQSRDKIFIKVLINWTICEEQKQVQGKPVHSGKLKGSYDRVGNVAQNKFQNKVKLKGRWDFPIIYYYYWLLFK